MAELPSGTVTLLFTDVEGSTRLLQELGRDRYVGALIEHRRVLREVFTSHGGVEVDMQGDSFLFAFASARDAVVAAAEAQRALAAHRWESEPIRVRIGLHTGEPLLVDGLYAGLDVHRAARVMAAGHGGQVLVSEVTAAVVRNELPSEYSLRDHGEHRLKDLSKPQRLYQIGEGEFPPLKTLYRTNLPIPATPFVGRERELRMVSELLRQEDVRLLTLTGPGGTGKTRLALQAVAGVADEYPDGVFWVPLAALRDPELVLETASQALGAKEGLVEHVADRRVLVLLDNFEHLVSASPEIAAALAACPGLDLVVTSRERLQLSAEHVWPVPPLERADAVDLFMQRARSLGVEPDSNAAVAQLCGRLDDLPLAVELAAARTTLFSPAQLLQRLGHRLDLLKGGRDADPRQHTLRATIQWSYDLLTPAEQTLFARLAVFAGGCTVKAAEEVCDADPDTLASLLDKSLLRRSGDRFWMLETIREYAAERLRDATNVEDIQQAHANWILGFTAAAEHNPAFVSRVRTEIENIRSALAWLDESGHSDQHQRLCLDLYWYWFRFGDFREGRRNIERSLALNADKGEGRMELLEAAGDFALHQRDFDVAERFYTEALAEARERSDDVTASHLLRHLSGVALEGFDDARAETLLEESLALARSAGDDGAITVALADLGNFQLARGRFAEALELSLDAAERSRQRGATAHVVIALLNGSQAAAGLERTAQAASLLAEALAEAVGAGHDALASDCLLQTADLFADTGDFEGAARLLGLSDHLREATGWGLQRDGEAMRTRLLAVLPETLGETHYSEAVREGSRLELRTAAEAAARRLEARATDHASEGLSLGRGC
jgi:predicted ATPase/class 3 adenylate cyclase